MEGGDLSELRAADLDDSVLSRSAGKSTSGGVVSNLTEQMSRATTSAMKVCREDSDDSMAYEDAAHPAMQMAFR